MPLIILTGARRKWCFVSTALLWVTTIGFISSYTNSFKKTYVVPTEITQRDFRGFRGVLGLQEDKDGRLSLVDDCPTYASRGYSPARVEAIVDGGRVDPNSIKIVPPKDLAGISVLPSKYFSENARHYANSDSLDVAVDWIKGQK